jgi:UDP-N-acetylmuramyl pentapeptide phosphotransferase/UDP-N-acetylglucosamine-1-phosphate transferase
MLTAVGNAAQAVAVLALAGLPALWHILSRVMNFLSVPRAVTVRQRLTTTLCACVAPHDKLLLHHHCRCATPSAQRQLALVTTLATLMMTLLTDLVKRSVQ